MIFKQSFFKSTSFVVCLSVSLFYINVPCYCPIYLFLLISLCSYSFLQRAKKVIKSHNSSTPLFLYMAFQNVHEPIQAPKQYSDKYSFIKNETRRNYAGMVDILDEAVGNITEAMKDAG